MQLRTHTSFSAQAVDNVQNAADDFFSSWIELTWYDGVTNCIHLLGSGHVQYFLQK